MTLPRTRRHQDVTARHVPVSIRSWLAVTLVLVSLLTAGTIALYVLPEANQQVRSLAQDAALGVTARTAHDVGEATTPAQVSAALAGGSRTGQLSLWLVDARHSVIAASALPSIRLGALSDSSRAITVALGGRRYVPSGAATANHVVALPAESNSGARLALVAYAPRAAFAGTTSDALRRKLVLGALIALGLAIVLSLVIATVVTRRVRRLASAAGTIAAGRFGARVHDGFPDEIGQLAASIDGMREGLAAAFAVLEHERGGLSLVLDRLEEGVIAIGPTGVVEVVNPAASTLLGQVVERGRALPAPWPADVVASRAAASQLGELTTTADGRILHVQRTALRPDHDDGAMLVVLSDRTEAQHRKAVEQRFMANASHELRTPLAAILASVEMLQAGAKDDIRVRDAFLDDVQHESERLQRLTDRLLTVARLDSGALQPRGQPVSARSRLGYVVELMTPLARAGDVSLTARGDGGMLADPDILDQVLVGLVGNALKHTPPGGSVELGATELGDRTVLTVADSGCGIASEHLPHVFDRFWRGDSARRADGFGLGLGISREYVEAMSGVITLTSAPGQGTIVEITLPRAGVLAGDGTRS
jgi:signal transduction histidine kinase/HAMP domain-containing protein